MTLIFPTHKEKKQAPSLGFGFWIYMKGLQKETWLERISRIGHIPHYRTRK